MHSLRLHRHLPVATEAADAAADASAAPTGDAFRQSVARPRRPLRRFSSRVARRVSAWRPSMALTAVLGALLLAGPQLRGQEDTPAGASPDETAPATNGPDVEAAQPPRFVVGNAAAADANAPRSSRQARVEVDEGTRTLFVTTDAATNEQVRQVIEAMEKPVPQALIKVLFLEVTHSNDLDLGVDITHDRTDDDGDRSVISSLFGVSSETRGGIVTVLQNDLRAALRAIGEDGKMNVLSRPSILARNNEEATITIGKEVPFIRNTRITDDGQTLNTIEYEDIGIILTVTPHIGADGLIALDVAPEISTMTDDFVDVSDTVSAPVITKRSAETHVLVPSGRTAVIGGLMEDHETANVTKVPLLGDIPWVGALFRRTKTSKSKTELLIFLTPTLVDSSTGVAAVTADEQRSAEMIRAAKPSEELQRYLGAPVDAAVPAVEGNQ